MDEGNGMDIVVPGIVAVVVVESVVVAVVVERNVGEEVRRRVGERTGCVRVYLYVRIGHRLREAASESEIIFCRKEILRLHRDASGWHPRRFLGRCPV